MYKNLPTNHKSFLLKCCLLTVINLFSKFSFAQPCASLNATAIPYESRCAATGSIKVSPTGGSGNYKYRALGVISSNYTSTDSIIGLAADNYTVEVTDLVTNCVFTISNVIVTGDYQDPRFSLTKVDVTCDNGNNGSVTVTNQQYGRAPYTYTIIAPSPMGVGTSNTTGIFSNLIAGDYGIQLRDSCGGVQTRRISIENYYWWIDSYGFQKISCDSATGYIAVYDNKGNASTGAGIPGFTYGIVRSPGDTVWSNTANFSFYLQNQLTFTVVVKDNCGKVKTAPATINFIPSIGNTIAISNLDCRSFTASVTNAINFFAPLYCLYDNTNTQLECNTTGIFTNLSFGSYCITAKDSCTDTTITRCFTQLPPPLSLGDAVLITNKNCTTFNVSITNPIGLTNPDFCLLDNNNVVVECNATGQFINLPYGSYCIRMRDGCRDTTIIRCFNPTKPTPVIPNSFVPSYTTCTNFGVSIGGDSLTNPLYCLYDSLGVLIVCNNTGIFDSLAYANYCVNVYDSCYDTTYVRCFTIAPPTLTNNITLSVSNLQCNSFSLQTNVGTMVINNYCLYNALDSLIICNNSGIFSNLPYGTYCVRTRNLCPDTTFLNCITVQPLIPGINSSIDYSNYTCTTFSAEVNGLVNFTNPEFFLVDSNNVVIDSNATGIFNNILYGSYCIRIKDNCYDTTIVRCFTRAARKISLSVTASKSCSYGYAQLRFNFGQANMPVNVKVFTATGVLYSEINYTSNNVVQDSIVGVVGNLPYTIIATDFCGFADTATISVTPSFFNYNAVVVQRCPSATAPLGAGDINVTSTTNMGVIRVEIIKRNGVSYSPALLPNSIIGSQYNFTNLSNATYIIRYSENDCNTYLYDTLTINDYQYPNLDQSSAYQCDANGFSVGAVIANGVGPFTYEIIGSVPATPSIVTAPQNSPIFTINNGTSYSLIRLRAIDACGNGTLNDASVLPLANTGISESLDCYAGPTLLSVDSIYNATYMWYKKVSLTATDSVYVGSGLSYFIPSLTPADTGVYVCVVNINNGCIIRHHTNVVNGICGGILSTQLKSFTGNYNANSIALQFTTLQESNLQKIWIEKSNGTAFQTIGNVAAVGTSNIEQRYSYLDALPFNTINYYRLRLQHFDGSSSYSSILKLDRGDKTNGISIYPNPVKTYFTILLKDRLVKNYKITLYNSKGENIFTKVYNQPNGSIIIERNSNWANGIYTLQVEEIEQKKKSILRLVLL